MDFEKTDYDRDDTARYKTVIDGEKVFIHITREAQDDDLKDGLTPDKQTQLAAIVTARLASGQLEPQPDKIGVMIDVILIRSGDLA
ncbi:MAG: hypothetical protein IH859_00430 [Chloroflexi bacterium]|nr:hypothetical protein [Chloroflexota bacterium]